MSDHDRAADNCATMGAWLATINTRDPDSFASHFADDVLFEDMASKRIMNGKAELVQYSTEWFASFPDTHAEQVSVFATADFGVIEWELTVTLEKPFDGLPKAARGRTRRIRGISRDEFASDGKVRRHRAYWTAEDLSE
ncbi:nuclear transport factor 2 family protein [Kitasatospora purpeofusca]|uniref:nuclear transport factor 2 family protein n=1 Tax=Kitasatospora purpeofusca TaxID=67352 RepID=UPI0036B5CCA6